MPKREPEYKSKTPTQIDWARLAAYIDGEGCIRIREKSYKLVAGSGKFTELRLTVSNCDPRLMAWLKDKFAGFVIVQSGKHRKAARYYNWEATGRHAEWVLENCPDFFVIKRDQAEVGLAHQALIDYSRRGTSRGTIPERMVLRSKLSLLKGTASIQKDEQGIRLNLAI